MKTLTKLLNRIKHCICLILALCTILSSNALALDAIDDIDDSISAKLEKVEEIADQAKDTAAKVLQMLSCEYGYSALVVQKRVPPHSCIETPVLDQFLTMILTLGFSYDVTRRLRMIDKSADPIKNRDKVCSRENRSDYWEENPKIESAICSNVMLVSNHVKSLVMGAVSNNYTLPNVEDFYIDIDDFGSPNINDVRAFSDFVVPSLIDLIPGVSASAVETINTVFVLARPRITFFVFRKDIRQDMICISMLGLTGFIPIGCKFFKEPFPKSIYELYDADSNTVAQNKSCQSVYNCTENAKRKSRTLIPILSQIISCITEAIFRIVISPVVCDPQNIDSNVERNLAADFASGSNGSLSTFHKFQTNMQKAVTSFLTLYVLLFGFNIATGSAKFNTAEIFNFLIKFLLVTYFSIGINMQNQNGITLKFDGMINFLVPFLMKGVAQLADLMMGASIINGLCEFTADPINGYDKMSALWDQIDCRIAYYIGLDGMYEKFSETVDDPAGHHVPPYLRLIIPAFFAGQISLVMLLLSYPVMVVSNVAYAAGLYLNSLILILILSILAPIIVPCALFKRTSNIFESWARMLLAQMLQPAVAIAFLTIVFGIYDRAFYGTCKYISINATITEGNILEGQYDRKFRSFVISHDASDYASKEEYNLCTTSLGYFLNTPFSALFGGDTKHYDGYSTVNPKDPARQEAFAAAQNKPQDKVLKNEDGSDAVKWSNGLFTQSPKMFWQSFTNIIKNLILCMMILLVMQQLTPIISNFIPMLLGLNGQDSNSMLTGLAAGNLRDQLQNKIEGYVYKADSIVDSASNKIASALARKMNNQQNNNSEKGNEDSSDNMKSDTKPSQETTSKQSENKSSSQPETSSKSSGPAGGSTA